MAPDLLHYTGTAPGLNPEQLVILDDVTRGLSKEELTLLVDISKQVC